MTSSVSTGSGGYRNTFTQLPGGKSRNTQTWNLGNGLSYKTSKTSGGIKKPRKVRIRKGKMTTTESTFFNALFGWSIVGAFGYVIMRLFIG